MKAEQDQPDYEISLQGGYRSVSELLAEKQTPFVARIFQMDSTHYSLSSATEKEKKRDYQDRRPVLSAGNGEFTGPSVGRTVGLGRITAFAAEYQRVLQFKKCRLYKV